MITRLCVVAALLLPAIATAQGNPGPFGGLFGRTPRTVGEDHTVLEVRSSLGAQYDTALLPEEGADDLGTESGVGGVATTGVMFEHTSARVTTNLRGGATRQQFFTGNSYGVNLFNANAQMIAKITTRVEAEAAAGYVHSPYFQFYQNFGQAHLVALDGATLPLFAYAASALENETIDGSAGLTGELTKRSKLTGGVYRRQTRFAEQPEDDFVLDGYRAAWTYQLRRDLGVRAGYGREHVDHRGDQRSDYDHEVIDVGVDFNRELSLARRTTLAFRTSTSFIKDSSSNRQFRLNGAISLSKHFRRTWQAVAQASRTTEFVPGFVEPLFTDAFGVSVSGMFSRRLNWMASASAGRGQYGFSEGPGFGTTSATTQLTYGISRYLGLYGQYVAYGYEVPKDATTLELPERLARQAFSVGFNAYLPVYNKTRQRQ